MTEDHSKLIACPHCDTLHHLSQIGEDERATCACCGTLLIAPRNRSFLHVVALSFTAMILMVAAFCFPFLQISARGLTHESSVLGAASAFSGGWLALLSVATVALIIGVPVFRFGALIYVLLPLSFDKKPWPKARGVFRLAERLQPWSMAEIFIIGTAVALVKIGGLATISFGPAFWAFCALIIVMALKNSFMSKWVIWDAIGKK
ncbi:paraquat-inducible protein A [Thioclava litoralis]|uniref:Paraquat-inducible protein A n=1 Tax=Thioclava litoralis TaxID=3076557 RepID=A0ABZ1DWT0_9RHOB|nr:paraquat-inducible protein A [Thioclava sp. FTW29]